MYDRIEYFYDTWHGSAKHNRANEIRDRDLIALDYLMSCRSVFELGCGSGKILDMCHAPVKAGADISKKAIDLAREMLSDERIQLQVLNIDKEELPWGDHTFDGCMAIEVLEHLFDPVHALAEMNRVLQNNGKLVVTVPNIGYYLFRWYHFRTGEMSDFHGNGTIVHEHVRFYGVASLRRLLAATGFRVVSVKGVPKNVVYCATSGNAPQSKAKQSKWRAMLKKLRGLYPMQIVARLDPLQLVARLNGYLRLYAKWPSLFALGLVIEAVKSGESLCKHNDAVDHQERLRNSVDLDPL